MVFNCSTVEFAVLSIRGMCDTWVAKHIRLRNGFAQTNQPPHDHVIMEFRHGINDNKCTIKWQQLWRWVRAYLPSQKQTADAAAQMRKKNLVRFVERGRERERESDRANVSLISSVEQSRFALKRGRRHKARIKRIKRSGEIKDSSNEWKNVKLHQSRSTRHEMKTMSADGINRQPMNGGMWYRHNTEVECKQSE